MAIPPATILTETNHYVMCPCGEKLGQADHIMDDYFSVDKNKEKIVGKWFCDNCGQSFTVTLFNDTIFLKKDSDVLTTTLIILKMIAQNGKDVLFFVKGSKWEEKSTTRVPGEFFYDDNDRYHYEEDACPVNWCTGDHIVSVAYDHKENDWDLDYHGIAKYIGTIAIGPGRKYEGQSLEKEISKYLENFSRKIKLAKLLK